MRVVTILLALSLPALAAESGLTRCVNIDNATARLRCYDEAAGRNTRESATVEPPPPAASADTATPAPVTATPLPEPVPAPAVEVAPYSEDDFGLEQARADKREEITSRLDGEFIGWSGRTLFKLENGQVWRQAETGRFRTSIDRPVVTIQRGAFSSYRLKVEGLNRTVRVKRIR